MIIALLFFCSFQILPSDNMMIITWGQPTNFSTSSTYSATSWDNCVTHCLEVDHCVLVHSTVTPVNCQVFETRTVFGVKKLDSTEGHLVAFKITGTSCPSGQNAPTFNNLSASGTSMGSTGQTNYNITFDGAQWSISYQNALKCAPGWETFSRPLTDWCIKVFGSPTDYYNQEQAVALCSGNNAVLSGLESQEERWFVANSSYELLGGDSYPDISAFWMSGVRKSECAQSGWETISYCNDDLLQFDWSDQYLTTFGGITWNFDQPDRDRYGTWQNCMQIWIRQHFQYNETYWANYPNAAADDQSCDATFFANYALRGAVCGKLPDV